MSERPSETFFIFKPQFDPVSALATFEYGLDKLRFIERVNFAPEKLHPDMARLAPVAGYEDTGFFAALDLAACILGTSYFKLRAPFNINGPDIALTPSQLVLVKDVYENGLGEFYARNELNRFGKLEFEFSSRAVPSRSAAPDRTAHALLLIGGGKDSLVSVQLSERAELDFTPFAVNPKGPILTSVSEIGRAPLYVSRTLDPEMVRLGSQPGYFNGHVPSTAMNSIVATLAACLYGYGQIILSNERSASEGNLMHDGRIVNHQHSKSYSFEKLFSRALSDIGKERLHYHSLLRPFSETRIAQIFANETRFDGVFSSCNQNFKLSGNEGDGDRDLWCNNCPKCRFVFLVLAPFMPKARLANIFGHDLLDDPAQIEGYRHLCGLTGHKPWECVGEILEAAACLWHLYLDNNWKHNAIIQTLGPELKKHYGEDKLGAAWRERMNDQNIDAFPEAKKGLST